MTATRTAAFVVSVLGIFVAGLLLGVSPSVRSPESGPAGGPSAQVSGGASDGDGRVILTAYWPRGVEFDSVRLTFGVGAPILPVTPLPRVLSTEKPVRWQWKHELSGAEVKGRLVSLVIRGPYSEYVRYYCEIRATDGRGTKTSHYQNAGCQFKF